jgi:hypothetical protein
MDILMVMVIFVQKVSNMLDNLKTVNQQENVFKNHSTSYLLV